MSRPQSVPEGLDQPRAVADHRLPSGSNQHSGLSVEAKRLALSDAKYVMAHSDWRTPMERTLARAYLDLVEQYEKVRDGWITADAECDRLIERERSLLEQYEVLKSSEAQAWNKAQFETDRCDERRLALVCELGKGVLVSETPNVSREPERVTVAALEVRILGDLDNMNLGQEDAITEAFSEAVNAIERRLSSFPELRIDTEET